MTTKRNTSSSSSQTIASQHQVTPGTPNISSMQRNHPVAFTDHPPPPPPPKSNSYGRHSGPKTPPPQFTNKGPTTPPPPPPRPSNYRQKDNSRTTHYSPVSDHSGSPKTPPVNSAYEAISDTEENGPKVEDISPASSSHANKEVGQEDDNMSLSPISPTDSNSKVELNVQSNKHTSKNPILPPLPPKHGIGPIPPPVFPPCPPPNFPASYFPPPPGGINTSIPHPPPNFITPPPQPPNQFNPQSMPFQSPTLPGLPPPQPGMCLPLPNAPIPPPGNNNNMIVGMLPALQNPPPPRQDFLHHRHSEILQSALFKPPTPSLINHNQPHKYNKPMLPKQSGQVLSQRIQQQQQQHQQIQTELAQSNSTNMEGLPFIFQVKAGCARDISQELKRIMSKDTLKKLVEQSAFRAFENWWEKQKGLAEPKIESTKTTITDKRYENSNKPKVKNITSVSDLKGVVNPYKSREAVTELIQTMFGYEKTMESQTQNFLSSFRISRRPQTSSTALNKGHVSRKRRPWPSRTKNNHKLQRIEESEEDEEDEESGEELTTRNHQKGIDDSEDDGQFEQFLNQRKHSNISLSQ